MLREERVFACRSCGVQFALAHGTGRPQACPSCQSHDLGRVLSQAAPSAVEPCEPDSEVPRGQGRCARHRLRGRRRRAGAIFRMETDPAQSDGANQAVTPQKAEETQ